MTALAAVPSPLPAQAAPAAPLDFLGFRPGHSRAEVEARLGALGGTWSCERSRVDPRFTECRGSLPGGGEAPLRLTASLVSDSVAVLMLRGSVGEGGLRRWWEDLAGRYGPAAPRRDGGQETWQWVRRSRMIRLTTRLEEGVRAVSVTLVHGPLLDNLGPSPPPR